jgi:site-specific DNA recombinase
VTNIIAASLVRVSSEGQESDGWGADVQIEEIKKYAKSHGMTIKYTLQDEISGDTELKDRPHQKELFPLVENKKIQAVIFHKNDRISRKNWINGMIGDYLISHGIELHIVDKGRILDANSITQVIENYQVQKDKEEIVKKLTKGKLAKIDAGNVLGSAATNFGYAKVSSKKETRYVINPAEAKFVVFIFEQYLTSNLVEIAQELTKFGVVSRYGNKVWTPAMVSGILNHKEVYNGRLVYKHKKVKGKRIVLPESDWKVVEVPKIIDDDLYEKVVNKLAQGRGKNQRKFHYLLASRLKCQCGKSINGVPHRYSKDGKTTFLYKCLTRNSSRYQSCDIKPIRVEIVDTKVMEFIDSLLDGKFIENLRSEQKRNESKSKPIQSSIDRINSQLEKKQKELKKILNLFLANEDESENVTAIYKEAETAIKNEIEGLEGDLVTKTQELADSTVTDEEIADWEKELRNFKVPDLPTNEAERIEAINQLDKHVAIITKGLFEIYRGYIERLKLRGTIELDHSGKRVLVLKFVLGEEKLTLDDTKSVSRKSVYVQREKTPQPA